MLPALDFQEELEATLRSKDAAASEEQARLQAELADAKVHRDPQPSPVSQLNLTAQIYSPSLSPKPFPSSVRPRPAADGAGVHRAAAARRGPAVRQAGGGG